MCWQLLRTLKGLYTLRVLAYEGLRAGRLLLSVSALSLSLNPLCLRTDCSHLGAHLTLT
jgi:hypothetical protein